jgi:hypothetical protein
LNVRPGSHAPFGRPTGSVAGEPGPASNVVRRGYDPIIDGDPDLDDGATAADAGEVRDAFDPSPETDPDPAGESLAVPLVRMKDGGPDWEETAAEMRVKVALITDPADTGFDDRFKKANRDVLDQMREGDRDAWMSVERRLGDRDPGLREGNG